MLGRFLELSLVTADTVDAWQRYQRLGFEPAPTGDIWPHAYGVVTCEGLAIGLHALAEETLSITFVRPQVAALHRELAAKHVEVEQARLGSDVFNELTLREPDGVALRVLEARSFSPPLQSPHRTALGSFVSLSLPSRDVDATQQFWRNVGHECGPSEEPWQSCSIAGVPLAVHPRRIFAEPVLVFRQPDADLETVIEAMGWSRERPLPALREVPHARWHATEDLAILLLEPAQL
jgi:hypothetical protein